MFHGTYVNEEGIGVCDWEAPDTSVVRDIWRRFWAPPTDPTIVVKKVL